MCHKLKIGLIRVQELFIGRGRFSWGVGGFFSKIRNLGSRQSCLYNCLYKYKMGYSVNCNPLYYMEPAGGIEPPTY